MVLKYKLFIDEENNFASPYIRAGKLAEYKFFEYHGDKLKTEYS
jgi:hypothetical protein